MIEKSNTTKSYPYLTWGTDKVKYEGSLANESSTIVIEQDRKLADDHQDTKESGNNQELKHQNSTGDEGENWRFKLRLLQEEIRKVNALPGNGVSSTADGGRTMRKNSIDTNIIISSSGGGSSTMPEVICANVEIAHCSVEIPNPEPSSATVQQTLGESRTTILENALDIRQKYLERRHKEVLRRAKTSLNAFLLISSNT